MIDHYSQYTHKVVAFIDILGFRNIVTAFSKRENFDLFNRLLLSLHRIKHIQEMSNLPNIIPSEFEVSVFSDCIVFSTQEKNIASIVWTAGYLQADLLYLGILSRGGIASGLTYHNDGILFGESFLKAYQIEQQTAFYPRIVLSTKLADKYKKIVELWCEVDDVTYINPFKFDAVAGRADELASDGYDPRAIYFKTVRDHLTTNRKEANEENYLAKNNWMINRFNNAVNEFNKHSMEKIDQIPA
ncbi:MAG: hypothetical protein AB1454_02010 [Candidatus Auribacterota bacterium]